MNLYLIGYRGCGKSTVAQRLAHRLWWHWVDADTYLEQQAGKSIREIFEAEGEAGFRERESRVLQELSLYNQLIVALGGGAVLRAENRSAIRGSGKTVWLQASPEQLWSRIEGDPSTSARRPNLTSQGGVEEVRRLLAERSPLYAECADLTLDTTGRSPDDLVAAIAEWAEKERLSA